MDISIDSRIQQSHATHNTTNKKDRQLKSLRKSSQDFETLLVSTMFKAMRKSVPDGGLLKKDSATEMFQEMLDMETAKAATEKNSIGIADAIYTQMSKLLTGGK